MSETCCLCLRDLSDSASKKKRKKLYGSSAEKSREILEWLSAEKLRVSLAGVVETSSSDSYVCHSCDGQLTRFARLKTELESVSREITAKLQCLHIVTRPSRKRPASSIPSLTDEPCSSSTQELNTEEPESPSVTRNGQTQESPTVQVSLVY